MIKTALIVPKGSKYGSNVYLKNFLEQNDLVSNFYGSWETPNLSLLTIAGLFPPQYSLHFIDEDHGEVIDFDGPYDLVAVTGMTQQINRAYEICREFRRRHVYTVIGGIHASIYPTEAGEAADTVMVGEGEEIFRCFLRDFEARCPQKIYREEGYIDLTQSPVPRYDLVNTSLYNSYSVQTTRGCPRTCSYCTLPVIYGNRYRHKTVDQVIAEIRAIKRINKSPFIFFADDNMFINHEHALTLVKKIGEEGIVWGTQTDISVAGNAELLAILRDAGCRWLFIGFENASRSSLEFLDRNKWKATMSEQYEKLIEAIHNAGVFIWGSFMFGTDHDNTDVFENTLSFTLRNNIYSGSFTILTPLPGTELFRDMTAKGRIIDYDWSRYTFWDIVYKPLLMTEEELVRGVTWVYDQFYSLQNTQIRMKRFKAMMKNQKRSPGQLRGAQV